jgi:hypothetical protein
VLKGAKSMRLNDDALHSRGPLYVSREYIKAIRSHTGAQVTVRDQASDSFERCSDCRNTTTQRTESAH